MLLQTQAIVLSLRKHTDNVSIAQLYTAEHGRLAVAVHGNKYRGVLTPLSIIEITGSQRVNQEIASLRTAERVFTPQHLTIDIPRQCVALFIAEILTLTARHPMPDAPLYAWLVEMVQRLDSEENIENLHLQFLLDYTVFLGIGIDAAEHPEWFIAPTTRQQRQQYLKELCAYYEEHIDDFHTPKSLAVLMEVFD